MFSLQRWYRIRPIILSLAAMVFFNRGGAVLAEAASQTIEQMEQGLGGDRQQGLDIFSPKAFQEAVKTFEQAKVVFAKKGDTAEYQTKVRVFNEARQRASRNADLVKRTIPEVLKARIDALRANAPEVSSKSFADAVKAFGGLIEKIEGGKPADAKKRAADAETLFRNAELEAIRISTINVAQDVLHAAEKAKAKEYAPLSYSRAESLITATNQLLLANRYAGDQAVKMAQEAAYQARLSVYLTNQARAAQEDKDAREKQFIEISGYVSQVAREVGVTPAYDEGYERPVSSILLAIRNLKDESLALSKEVSQRNQEIGRLQQESDSLSQQILNLKQQIADREAGLRAQVAQTQDQLEAERRALAAKRAFEQKVANIEGLFTEGEASVIQERGNLVIRLYGLSFKSGQATIQPEYFSLLSKVQRAIREFPESRVTVEGHTDAVGYQELNQKLSEDRANAVREYIIANMGLNPSSVTSVGYGDARPIANNATPEGRAKNRRIDIVITP